MFSAYSVNAKTYCMICFFSVSCNNISAVSATASLDSDNSGLRQLEQENRNLKAAVAAPNTK